MHGEFPRGLSKIEESSFGKRGWGQEICLVAAVLRYDVIIRFVQTGVIGHMSVLQPAVQRNSGSSLASNYHPSGQYRLLKGRDTSRPSPASTGHKASHGLPHVSSLNLPERPVPVEWL